MLYCISYCGARSRYMVHYCWKMYLRGKTCRFLLTPKVFYVHRHIKHTLTHMQSFPFNLAVRGWRHNSKKNYIILQLSLPAPSLFLWPSLHLCSVHPFIILSHYSPVVSCTERCSESTRHSDLVWLISWKIQMILYKGNRLKFIHKSLLPLPYTFLSVLPSVLFYDFYAKLLWPSPASIEQIGSQWDRVTWGDTSPLLTHTHTCKRIHIPAAWPSHAFR